MSIKKPICNKPSLIIYKFQYALITLVDDKTCFSSLMTLYTLKRYPQISRYLIMHESQVSKHSYRNEYFIRSITDYGVFFFTTQHPIKTILMLK